MAESTQPPSPPSRPSGGTADGVTFGRYVLLEELGSGGMGIVYAALDPDLNRKVALKLLRGDRHVAGRPEDSQRLLREAKAMARLHHPNVVTVHDVGQIDDRVFVAMEFVDGPTLKQHFADRNSDWREIMRIMLAAGRGLEAAHEAGIIHRDFKPENVLLGKDDAVKVLDFGLARPPDPPKSESSQDSEDPERYLTRPGVVLGTPLYMSPEQHRALPLDERADQFSFCATLYEGVFWQRPFSGKNRATLAVQACNGRVTEVPADSPVPPHVRNAILRGLRPQAGERWPSMHALLEALERDPARTRRRLALTVGAIGLGVTGLVGAFIPRPSDDPCQGVTDPLQETWNDTRREALRSRLVADGEPWAGASAQTAQTLVDAWAEQWSTARRDVCEATRVRHEQSAEYETLRSACLEHQRLASHTVLEQLEARDAVALASALPSAESCTTEAHLRWLREHPDADELAVALARLTIESAAPSEASLAAGRTLLTTARELEDPMAEARIEVAVARQLLAHDDLDAAASAFEHAAQTALGTDAPAVATQAWIGMARTELRRENPARAELWLRFARAELGKLDAPATLEADAQLVMARVHSAQGRHEQAAAAARAGLRQLERRYGERHFAVAYGLEVLAGVLEAGGDAEAGEYREEAEGLWVGLLGAGHPDRR